MADNSSREIRVLSEKAKAEIQTLITKYPHKRSAIMPALHLAQRECGWLPDDVLEELSSLLGY